MNAISAITQQTTSKNSAYNVAWIHTEQSVKRLLSSVKNKSVVARQFHGVFACVESLPLSSEEFASANRRLHNAMTYCEAQEYGAALFEVTLLYRSIRGETECLTSRPKVKLRF